MIRPSDGQPRLADFLRTRRAEIIAKWESAVRVLPMARTLDRARLLDEIAKILGLIADLVDDGAFEGAGSRQLHERATDEHAIERLDEGYDLGAVVTEYSVL